MWFVLSTACNKPFDDFFKWIKYINIAAFTAFVPELAENPAVCPVFYECRMFFCSYFLMSFMSILSTDLTVLLLFSVFISLSRPCK